MIDPRWLEGLNFQATDDIRITGLSGIGSEKVALKGATRAGQGVVATLPRTTLGLMISETPPCISLRPEYDVDRVNRKLLQLVGKRDFDLYSVWIARLYSFYIQIIGKSGYLEAVLATSTSEASFGGIPMMANAPPLRRRLHDYATWPRPEGGSEVIAANGEEFQLWMQKSDFPLKWASNALSALDSLECETSLQPDRLFENPLVVWGAAALEGFFTTSEMLLVSNYIEGQFGRLNQRRDSDTIAAQAFHVGSVVTEHFPDADILRFAELCTACGFAFQFCDKNDQLVADGIQFLK